MNKTEWLVGGLIVLIICVVLNKQRVRTDPVPVPWDYVTVTVLQTNTVTLTNWVPAYVEVVPADVVSAVDMDINQTLDVMIALVSVGKSETNGEQRERYLLGATKTAVVGLQRVSDDVHRYSTSTDAPTPNADPTRIFHQDGTRVFNQASR